MPGLGNEPTRELIASILQANSADDLNWWFKLIEEGYDVWLANFRGTQYSQKHTTLDNNSFDYWNIGVAEFGIYDIPAFIELVYTHNGGHKVYPITVSLMSTSMHLALATELEENFFADRVEKAI